MSVGSEGGIKMSVINMAKNIKEVHPNALVCYKVGAFVNCYGKDVYIISYLFDYKIKMVTDSMICKRLTKDIENKHIALF